jgi:hypothetical protein
VQVTRDQTDKMLSEKSLRESEQLFRHLVDGVRECAIYMLDPQARHLVMLRFTFLHTLRVTSFRGTLAHSV